MKDRGAFLSKVHKKVFPWGLTGVEAKRLFKAWLATTICFILTLIRPLNAKLGTASYVIAIAALNHHPGRRLGGMFEAVVLGLIGTGFGVAFCVFGHFVTNEIAAYSGMKNGLACLAILEIIMLTIHAFIRSYSPRLFNMVFMFFTVSHFGFLSSLNTPYGAVASSFAYPILLGIAICFIINLLVFPEFGSTYLGTSIVDALNQMHTHVNTTVLFFTGSHENLDESSFKALKMDNIIAQKASLRSNLINSKAVLTESLFEISFSIMSPQELKNCLKIMTNITVPLNALVGACELEYSLLGESHIKPRRENSRSTPYAGHNSNEQQEKDTNEDEANPPSSRAASFIESVKPTREIEHADEKIFLQFLSGIRQPILKLSDAISQSFNIIKLSVAYSYDVPEKKIEILTTDRNTTPSVSLESIDNILKTMAEAITLYDVTVPASLEKITLTEKSALAAEDEILMPREEFFLISSFLLNFREFSNSIVNLLNDTRILLETRKHREERGLSGRRVWFSGFSSRKVFKKYLITGSAEPKETDVRSFTGLKRDGEEGSRKVSDEREKTNRKVDSREYDTKDTDGSKNHKRDYIADLIEYPHRYKIHLRYTLKFVLLLMAVSFPAFSPEMRTWYTNIRGTWVGFIAAMAMESSIGGTFKFFLARSVGVVLGSGWSYLSYVAGNYDRNRYAMSVVFAIGVLPAYYFVLKSPYPKAGFIYIISANMVALSTANPSVPGTILENFAKRCLAMFIGGAAALLVQITLYPIKARTELVRNITRAIQYCNYLEGYVSIGIEKAEVNDLTETHQHAYDMINIYSKQAKQVLGNAEIYLGLTNREPRLKGSFSNFEKVYAEIIFVLRQVIEKFQNISFLRSQYGTAVVDELNVSLLLLLLVFFLSLLMNYRNMYIFIDGSSMEH